MIRTILALALAAAFVPLTAAAQAPVEGLTIGEQIRGAVEELRARQQRFIRDEETLPDEAGVFVLRTRDIFSLRAAAGGGYSSNPARNDLDGPDSAFVTGFADAGVDTQLADILDAGARATVSATHYPDATDVDNFNTIGSVYLGGDVYYGLYLIGDAQVGFNFADIIEDHTFFYATRLTVSRDFPLDPRFVVTPFASVGYYGSQTEEQRNLEAGGGLKAVAAVVPDLIGSASFQYSYIHYPDYFEDVTLVERSDERIGFTFQARYVIEEWLSVSATAGYTVNDSNLAIADYRNFQTTGLLRVSIRF